MTENNVIDIRTRRPALFTHTQRERLGRRVSHLTSSPDEVVRNIEEDLCLQAVEKTRGIAAAMGERIGRKIADYLFK